MSRSPRSVLVGMGETAGWCTQLVAGLRAVGVRADHLDLGPDRMQYRAEPRPLRVRVVHWLGERRRSGPGPRAAWTAIHRLGMAWLFVHALVRYDAFVFRGGDSFFGLRDLALLRRLGKPVLVVFFGSDSRPPYLNGVDVARAADPSWLAAETAARRRMVERTEREAAAIACHVMSAQLHARRAVAFLAIGIPRARGGAPPAADGGSVRALHAPSASGKGTDAIRAAIQTARAAGVDVELEVIQGRPNVEVLDAIERCHFVIDQLYADTPMAAFAAEAAARGRPAIVGGLGWDELRARTPAEMLPPAHLCHPDEVADAVALLATDHAYRAELGERARRFVNERWSPHAVAGRVMTVLRGETPEAWLFDPAAVVNPFGAGLAADGSCDAVRAVIDVAGVPGLQVADKPDLERRLVALATEAAQ